MTKQSLAGWREIKFDIYYVHGTSKLAISQIPTHDLSAMAIPPSGSELFLAPDLASNPIPGNNFTPSKDIHGVSLESCTPISNELTGPRNPQSPGGGSASPTRAEITETLLESFGQKSSSMQVLANINKRKAGEIEDADNSPDSTRVCLTVEQKQGRSANDREPDNSDYDSNHKSCNVSPGLKTAHIDINLNSDLDYQEMRRLCDHDHSDPALRVSRTSNDNRQDWDYHSLPDYSPPTSTLDGGNPKLLFKLDWSPNNKLDLSSDPDRHLLHEAEIHLASALRLSCAKYLCAKRRMFKGRLQSLKMGREGWKTDAQKSCKISMNKASKMCLAYENVGWFKAEHFIQYINKDANSSIDGVNESDITVLSSSSPHFRSEENATAVADTNLDLFQDDRPSTSSDLSEQDIWAGRISSNRFLPNIRRRNPSNLSGLLLM